MNDRAERPTLRIEPMTMRELIYGKEQQHGLEASGEDSRSGVAGVPSTGVAGDAKPEGVQ